MARKTPTKSKPQIELPPKKPAGAFFKYTANIRPELEKEFPDLKPAELRKVAGDRWQELAESDKQPYKARFIAEMEEYKKDLEAFRLRHPEEKVQRKGKAAASKVSAPQKKKTTPTVSETLPSPQKTPRKSGVARQAFHIFEQGLLPELKSKHPDSSASEISKQLGIAWKTLDAEERTKYQDMAAALEAA